MNQEIAEFFVKFTSEGLADVKSAVDDLSKKMDDVAKSTEKANKSHKSFFGNIVKWGTLLAGFTTTVYGLKKAWEAVGVAAANTMDIYQQSLMAGTSPQTIERWQRVAEHQNLSPGMVPSSFMSLRKFLYDFENLQIGEELNKTIGLALKDVAGGELITQAIVRSIETGNADTLLSTLNRFLSSGLIKSVAAHDLLQAFGLDNDTMFALLHQSTLATQLENAKLIYTGNPEVLEASAGYIDAKASLKDSWRSIWANPEMITNATHLMNLINDTILPKIDKFVTENWPKIEAGVTWLFNWIIEKLEYLVNRFGSKEDRENLKNTLKNVTAGALGGAAAGALAGGGVPGAIIGGIAGGVAGYMASEDAKDIIAATDIANVPTTTNIQQNESNATAVVNIDGYEVVRKTGNGYTEVSMSLPTPSSTR